MAKRTILITLFILLLFQLPACLTFKRLSKWRDRDIIIDGQDTEWQGRMTLYDKLYLGACNDGDFLYLCISTTDKNVQAQLTGILGQNFTLWFDPGGKKNKVFGLRFWNDPPPRFMENPVEPGKNAYRRRRALKEKEREFELRTNPRIEVLEGDEAAAPLADATGVEVKLGTARFDTELIYEMKIPLKTTDSIDFALVPLPGKPIGVYLETSDIKPSEIPLGYGMGEGGRMTGGGSPHMGSGRGSRGGGNGGGMDFIEPIRIYGKLYLSAKK